MSHAQAANRSTLRLRRSEHLGSIAFWLDVVGLGALAASQLLRMAISPHSADGGGLFVDIPQAVFSSVFLLAVVSAGVAAGWALLLDPLRSRLGRWAMSLAVFNIVLLPGFWALSWIVTPLGLGFRVGWGLPLFPFWLASGVGAICLGLAAGAERKEGLLLIPMLLGAALLTLFLGDMVPTP